MKPANKEDIMSCVNSTYALLLFSLKHWHAVPFSLIMSLLRILGLFAAKSDVLQVDQVKTTPVAFMKTYTHVFLAEKGQDFRFASLKCGQLQEWQQSMYLPFSVTYSNLVRIFARVDKQGLHGQSGANKAGSISEWSSHFSSWRPLTVVGRTLFSLCTQQLRIKS